MAIGNGTEEKEKRNLWRELTTLVSDHVELASLELGYESQQIGRRLVAIAVGLGLAFIAFALLQVALVGALLKVGLSLGGACLSLAAVYGIAAGVIVWIFGRRNPRAGRPFSGTQREIQESLRWIQNLFS